MTAVDTLDVMREAEIRALDLLGDDVPDVLQQLVQVAATVTGSQIAEIHVITSTSQHTLVGTAGTPDPCSATDSYCARIVREPARTHRVPDVRLDERFKDSPFTTSGAVVSYAASQLVTRNGVPVGTLCVFDPEHTDMDERQMKALQELSDAAMTVLEGRRHHEELEKAVRALAQGHSELRRSNEHLAAFAGQVAHDVQGPLAAVLLALQLLEEEESRLATDDDSGLLLHSALSGAQRMRATIAGLMEFAVIGGTLDVVRLDMDAVVADVLADLRTRRGRSEIVVEALPKVWGDDVQVRAVTQNLVANALKYAGHVDHPVIRVTGERRDGGTRVTVTDNGPGVPPAQRRAIFDLLVRGEDVEATGVEGLGIGLATCRRIVEAHGGRIGVDEAPGGGAAFWFELPDVAAVPA